MKKMNRTQGTLWKYNKTMNIQITRILKEKRQRTENYYNGKG